MNSIHATWWETHRRPSVASSCKPTFFHTFWPYLWSFVGWLNGPHGMDDGSLYGPWWISREIFSPWCRDEKACLVGCILLWLVSVFTETYIDGLNRSKISDMSRTLWAPSIDSGQLLHNKDTSWCGWERLFTLNYIYSLSQPCYGSTWWELRSVNSDLRW